MPVLYRKYRPQTFSEVVNQKATIETLKNQVSGGGIAHAYLFTGSRGVGKTSVARILAKAVNCLHAKNGEPDGSCEICLQIAAGNFLDLVEIDAASNTGVDNIRELIEHVKFSPSLGKYKVFIIDEVHMLSKGAFNALLKTLEEPPSHAIFILATTEINKVPATIVSRTQRFDFKALSAADIQQHILDIVKKEKFKLEKEIVSLVAQNAQGSLRDALSLLDKVMSLGTGASLKDAQQLLGVTDAAWSEELFGYIVDGNLSGIPEFLEKLQQTAVDLGFFNRDFLQYLRRILTAKVSGQNSDPANEKISELAEKISLPDLLLTIRLFLKSFKDLSSTPDPEIPLLVAAIEAAGRGGKNSPAAAQRQPEKIGQPAAAAYESEKNPPTVVSRQIVLETVPEVSVEFEQVKSSWDKVVVQIKNINNPLASMLKHCQLMGVEGGAIIVGVKFLFDKQSLQQAKNVKIIAEALRQIFGQPLALRAEVIKPDNSQAAEVTLVDALQVFGGELIE